MAEFRGCDFPDDLSYDDELTLWFRQVSAGVWDVGLTPFGLALSGEVYMFNPKPVGREIESGRAFGVIEVAKTILTVRSPFACVILATHAALEDQPGLINRDPYGSWLVRLAARDARAPEGLLVRAGAVAPRAMACMDLHNFISAESFRISREY